MSTLSQQAAAVETARRIVQGAIKPPRTAADLLRLAIEGHERGATSGKLNTRMLYGDLDLLSRALAEAEARAA